GRGQREERSHRPLGGIRDRLQEAGAHRGEEARTVRFPARGDRRSRLEDEGGSAGGARSLAHLDERSALPPAGRDHAALLLRPEEELAAEVEVAGERVRVELEARKAGKRSRHPAAARRLVEREEERVLAGGDEEVRPAPGPREPEPAVVETAVA